MKNLKIGLRLIGSYLVVAIFALIVGLYLIKQIGIINEGDAEMYERVVVPLSSIATQIDATLQMRLLARDISTKTNIKEQASVRDSILRIIDSKIDVVMGELKEQRDAALQKANRDRLDAFMAAVQNYQKEVRNWAGKINMEDDSILEEPKVTRNIVIPAHLSNLGEELMKMNMEIADAKEKTGADVKNFNAALGKFAKNSGIAVLIALIIIAVSFGVYMTFSITKPLAKMVEAVGKGSGGNLSARSGLNQCDELGAMAKDLDNFFENLSEIIKDLRTKSETLAGASEELSSVSKQLASGAEQTVAQSATVASTTEEMSVNINAMASGAEQASANANDVAGAAEQMSANMNTIAAAVEEMSASINQISTNANSAREIAGDATTKASRATNVMSELGSAAKEVGLVTDVIKRIADKTNLLALNATIEAASAGEAGKGFAVVAGEIKELANQSARSADDIAKRIEGIQHGTTNAISVIQDVNEIISKINQSVDAIAGHVDQQTKASNEIASNVSQANTGAKTVASAIGEVAKGVNDVSNNASEAAKGTNCVSSNVVDMNQVAKESAQGALQVNASAVDLSKIASDLKETVSKFKV